MKIRIKEFINDLDGTPITKGEKALDLAHFAINAILSVQEKSKDGAEEKLKKWDLAKKIQKADGETEFTVEEVSLIKKSLADMYGPLIYGQCHDIIENKA